MSRKKVTAMSRALAHLRDILNDLKSAQCLLDHVELVLRDAPKEKREHMLNYCAELERALNSSLWRTGIAVAEAAHLTVEDQK